MPTSVIPVLAAAAIAERLAVELPFELPVPATSEEEHRRALATGIDTAREQGMLTTRGTDPALADVFRLLHRPAIAVHLLRGDIIARADRRVLAAADGERAILAEVRPDGLAIRPIRPTALAAELVATLPAAPAASGPRSATAPRAAVLEALQVAGGLPGALSAELVSRGVRSSDARPIATALTARRTALTHIYTGHIYDGPASPMDVLDTEHGRYVATARGSHIVLAPGRPEVIQAKIDELIGMARVTA